MNFKNFLINKSATIHEALELIALNANGFILVHDDNKSIIGVATDGDIRAKIIERVSVDDSISECVNYNFVFADKKTTRETILRKLDHNIKFIPVLDDNRKLVNIVTKDFLPLNEEYTFFTRSKAPVRISFGGGGSDVTSYFSEYGGAVINTTISLYTHSTLIIRIDDKIIINSTDLSDEVEFESLSELEKYQGKFSLIQSIIKLIKPKHGFELYINSDFPMSSGLGGSAVVAASVLGCFNQLRADKWDQYEIAEIAFQAERIHLGVAGGWQDQYATVFGGLNFIEFNKDQNIINPIRLNNEILIELEENLILCYSGQTHDSGNIHVDQKEQTKTQKVKERIKENVDLTYQMKNYLLKGKLDDFGIALHKAWILKRTFSTKISNAWLDQIYNGAIQNGALGGKLLGAGGGGYFLFYVQSQNRNKLLNWLKDNNLNYTPFVFESNGLQSWTVRNKQS